MAEVWAKLYVKAMPDGSFREVPEFSHLDDRDEIDGFVENDNFLHEVEEDYQGATIQTLDSWLDEYFEQFMNNPYKKNKENEKTREIKREDKPKECWCGAKSVNSSKHQDYCPLYEKDS